MSDRLSEDWVEPFPLSWQVRSSFEEFGRGE